MTELRETGKGRVTFVIIISLLALILSFELFGISSSITSSITITDSLLSSTTPQEEGCPPELQGLEVLMLKTHLYGNLGDEMETAPVLKELKRCGVQITGIMQFGTLAASTSREHGLFKEIASFDDPEYLNPDDYDAVIVAPGPWWLGSIANSWKDKRIDILFGGSIMDDIDMGSKWGNRIANVFKPSLIVSREKHAYEKYEEVMQSFDFETQHLFSGDFSNSFEYAEAGLKYWERQWKKLNLDGKKVLFIRKSNKDNYEILRTDRQVRVKKMDQTNLTLNADDVIFATSAPEAEGDDKFFAELRREYGDIFRPDQFQILDNIEKMWALILTSDEVITDRCEYFFYSSRLLVYSALYFIPAEGCF